MRTVAEAIDSVLSRQDIEMKGSGRSVKVVRALWWWVVNFDNGKSAERTYKASAIKVAEKYIESGVVPKYGMI